MSSDLPQIPPVDQPMGTRATSDETLVESWLESLGPTTRKKFTTTACRLLEALERRCLTLRSATVEDVREIIAEISLGSSQSSAAQYAQRVKSLFSYAHRLGYVRFNPGGAIRVKAPGGQLAKRILGEAEVALLIRAAGNDRDRVMFGVLYGAGLRISELAGLTWGDVIQRGDDTVQICVVGKGSKVRQVVLPDAVGRRLREQRAGAASSSPVFASRTGRPLHASEVNRRIKQAAAQAGIPQTPSAHWLRHCHASHALARGASLAEVRETLGHGNISTTSVYLHARPNASSGKKLDESIF